MKEIIEVVYKTKITNSNNTYMDIPDSVKKQILTALDSVHHNFSELALSNNNFVTECVKWYHEPNKDLPYSTLHKHKNSPSTFISGVLNNMRYGNQYDFADTQFDIIKKLLEQTCKILEAIKYDEKIVVQNKSKYGTIQLVDKYEDTSGNAFGQLFQVN